MALAVGIGDRCQVTGDRAHVTHEIFFCCFLLCKKKCFGATLRTRKEIQCLPYAGFGVVCHTGGWFTFYDFFYFKYIFRGYTNAMIILLQLYKTKKTQPVYFSKREKGRL